VPAVFKPIFLESAEYSTSRANPAEPNISRIFESACR